MEVLTDHFFQVFVGLLYLIDCGPVFKCGNVAYIVAACNGF